MHRFTLAAGSMALMLAAPAVKSNGFASRAWTSNYRSTQVYYNSPVVVYYANPACVPIYPVRQPAPGAQPGKRTPTTQEPPLSTSYARPTAAPPSAPLGGTPAPEPAKPTAPAIKPPVVSEFRNYYDVYAVTPSDSRPPASDRCSATFWNLTGKDQFLRIDGTDHKLSAGKNLVIGVNRNFIWKMEGRDPQSERISAGEWALEVVIRR